MSTQRPDCFNASPALGLMCAGTVVALALCGCLLVTTVDTARLPSDWRSQIDQRHRTLVDPSGSYLDNGQATDANPRKNGSIREHRSLALFLFQLSEPNLPVAEVVRLALSGDTRLTVVLVSHDQTVWSRELDVRIDAADGTLVLPRQVKGWTEKGETAHVEQQIRLFRGTDGALYAHVDRTMVGVAAVIPVYGSGDGWGRWLPPPAAAVAGASSGRD